MFCAGCRPDTRLLVHLLGVMRGTADAQKDDERLRSAMEDAVKSEHPTSAVEFLPPHVLRDLVDAEFALHELEMGILQSRGLVGEALSLASDKLLPSAVSDLSFAPAVEDAMVSLVFPGGVAPPVCFTPSARRASAVATDSAATAVRTKQRILAAARYPAASASSPDGAACAHSASRAVDGLSGTRLRERVIQYLRSDGMGRIDGRAMASSRRRELTAEQLRATWLRRGSVETGSRLELLLGALRGGEERLQGEFGVRFPALFDSVAVGGLPIGDWAEAERCTQTEVDTGQVLAAYARGSLTVL
jgi:hypothetical protein